MKRSFLKVSVASVAAATVWSTLIVSAQADSVKPVAPVKVGVVYFGVDSAALTPAAKSTLSALVPKLSTYSKLTLTGYIQKTGTTTVLKTLGLQRAESVKAFFAAKGVKVPMLTVGALYQATNASAAEARNVTITGVPAPITPKTSLTVVVYSSFSWHDRVSAQTPCSDYPYVPSSVTVTGPGNSSKTLPFPALTGAGAAVVVGPITNGHDWTTCTFTATTTSLAPGSYTLALNGTNNQTNSFGEPVLLLSPLLTPVDPTQFRTLSVSSMTPSLQGASCIDSQGITDRAVKVTLSRGATTASFGVNDDCN